MANRTSLFFDIFAIDRTKATFSQIFKSTDTLGSKLVAVGKLAAVGAAAGLVAFAGKGVKSFLEFDDKMTQSLAIMGEVSGPMRKKMEDAARAVGRSTRFGADEAAEAYFFLASAGMDAEQAVAAMPQVAKFATAGMFDLARATDLATDAQSALGMASKDPQRNLENLTRITDVLVGANTLANASVEQFSQALTNRAGPALRAVNKDVEEGVAVLAAMADQGIKGQLAGNQLSIVMRDLQSRALDNKQAFEQAGVAVFDAAGNMNNLGDIVGQLERRLDGMSDAQKRAELAALGFTDRSMGVLMALLGTSAQIKEYERDLRGMAGVTDEVAGKQLRSFAARLDILKSTISDWGMAVGEALVNASFAVGETVGEMARMFGELPGPIQGSIGALAGIVAAAPIAIGSWRKVKATIDSVRASYLAMSAAGRAATLSLGVVGLVLAAGAAILAFFAARNVDARNRVDELSDSLDRQTGAITESTRAIAMKRLEDEGALEAADMLGISLDKVTDAALGDADAIRHVERETAKFTARQVLAAETTGGQSTKLTEQEEAARDLTDQLGILQVDLGEAAERNDRLARAAGEGAEAQDELAEAAADAQDAIMGEVDAVKDLIDRLDEATKTIFAARDAERAFEAALDDATDAAARNGATLDITTEAGRENEKQLDKLADAALKAAAAALEDAEANGTLSEAQQQVEADMKRAREEFIKVARQMGLTKGEAKDLADQLGLIPGNYKAVVSANTGPAYNDVTQFLNWVSRQRAAVTSYAPGLPTGRPQMMQHGGPARRGQFAIVGEAGPELVRFNRDARVFSNSESRRMMGEVGGGDGAAAGGMLTGQLYLDSGEFLGVVRGVVAAAEDGSGRRVAEHVRSQLRTNPTFRSDVRAAVR